MAGCDGEKRYKASRRADGRENAFRSEKRAVRIGRNELRRRLARFSRACTGIAHIDLPSEWSVFHEISGGRAKGHIAAIGAHGWRVAFLVCGAAIGRR